MQLAAIDIGTNSLHMIVVRVRPDLSFEVVDREKDMVRLGAGGLEGGRLSQTAMATALQTLAKFRRLAESRGVDEIIATATSAVRESKNGGDFIADVQRTTGIRVGVITGTEEARLIHLAAAYATGIGSRIGVVIDIGGGSVEVTSGTAARMQLGRSFKLGVIRLADKYIRTDPLSRRDERRMTKAIRRDVRECLRRIRKTGFERVIGTSGTILTLGELAGSRRSSDGLRNLRVSAKAIRRLRRRLTDTTLVERLKMPGLDPKRADLAVAGAVLLDTLLEELGAHELTLCDYALREGLILDYIKRNRAHIQQVERYPDVRRRSVVELAERCNYLGDHARQVAKLALQAFDQTAKAHGLGDAEREWLEYAALLHDIGVHISYERHHKHSYYLIKNGGLRGFEPREIEIIALISRYHRQAPPRKSHPGFGTLTRKERDTVRMLGALLRLAEGLERSHSQVISRLHIKPARKPGKAWKIDVRTTGDAELELWAASRHAAVLSDLVGHPITFDVRPASGKSQVRAPKGRVNRRGRTQHAKHAHHTPRVSRKTVRRRGH
jgi:exopolyphosphatase/guanosine-5'-triphosphate,3'-diphosphate pyrophosphatase